MALKVLVVGGTGPTGVPLVNNFLAAGHGVTIMHSGSHPAGFAGEVGRIIGDARDDADIAAKLGNREWDIAVCSYGKLRALATTLAKRTRRLVAITGQPVYRGLAAPMPKGTISLPVREYAPRQYDAANYTGKVAVGEDQLMEQHGSGDFETVILRYPGVFGPRTANNHEWAVVRRALDRRPFMILPHDGSSYFQRGYVENLAWLVYLAATRPEAAGQAFNAGDEQVLPARRVAEIIIDELKSPMELVGMPAELCRGVFPLAEKSSAILDMSKARLLLGYRDRIDVEAATRLTARHLADNPPDEKELNPAFIGRFDYPREDRLRAEWQKALDGLNAQFKSTGAGKTEQQ
jgi:nucleoside-diphosphate-sugar epimerase